MQNNFKYFDDLIHSGAKEIFLDSDIVLSDGEESEYKYGIELDVDDLTIDGNGHTIDAQGKTRIFSCSGKNIIIKNITLKNGYAKEKYTPDGGAIYNSGNLTITCSTLTENTSKGDGGAIYNVGSLTIIESAISGNSAKNGGAIYNLEGKVTITRSTLNNNTTIYSIKENFKNTFGELFFNEDKVQNRFGGAIYNGLGDLTINESAISGNSAKNGGAIYNKIGNFKIFNCEFSNNKSPNNIILNKDSLQIHNTTLKGNQSEYIVLNDGDGANLSIFKGEFKENNISKSVLSNSGKFASVERTVFENNILNNTINIINKSELNLTNLKIKDKEKSILNQNYVLIRKSPPELENKIYGEGIVEVDEKIIPQGENFDFGYLDKKIHESKNKEIILDHDIILENYERDFYEGGIELDIDNLIIDGNGKTINGSDKSRIFIITGKNITLKNIIFKNGRSHKNHDNPLNSNGGAIKLTYDNSITIENCEFINNTSEEYAGVIWNLNGEITITESTFIGNTTKRAGGAIYNKKGELTITGSTLNNNTAGYGGAIDNLEGKVTITRSTLTGNTSEFSSGGAIYNQGKLTITESTLTENTGKGSGGAIYDREGELSITSSTLIGNIAKSGFKVRGPYVSEFGHGGAIGLLRSRKYESENCTFKDNKPDDVHEMKY